MDQYEAAIEAYYAKEAFEEAQEETWREAAEASGEGGRALREALEEVRKKRESLAKVREDSFKKFEETFKNEGTFNKFQEDEAREEVRRAHQAFEEARQKLVQMVKRGARGSTTISQTDHVFISYVREDYDYIERLVGDLKSHGIRPWLDRNDITPGARWKRVIRRAISEGSFFLACFSPNYSKRSITYMNEELLLATEMLRKMPADRLWFIPVLLEECTVPDLDIGAGETLRDIQYVSLYEDWNLGMGNLLSRFSAGSIGRLS